MSEDNRNYREEYYTQLNMFRLLRVNIVNNMILNRIECLLIEKKDEKQEIANNEDYINQYETLKIMVEEQLMGKLNIGFKNKQFDIHEYSTQKNRLSEVIYFLNKKIKNGEKWIKSKELKKNE